MTIIAQPTKKQSNWQGSNALITENNRISGSTGDSAGDFLERFSYPTQSHSSLETSQQYPSTISNLLVITSSKYIHGNIRKYLGGALIELAKMSTWQVGWNGYNAPMPEHNAILYAAQCLINFFQGVMHLGWIEPNVTGGPEGEVVFEWWLNKKKLTIYIGEENIEYVQVWGKNIDAKITDGDLESIDDFYPLWMWLMN
jgi:hypothetical protein